jgi:hypothetical protein
MSQFRTIVHVDPLPSPLQVESKVYFAGSCFAENMAAKMQQLRMEIVLNPFGIIYNPIALAEMLHMQKTNTQIPASDIFAANGVYQNWQFHSKLGDVNPETALQNMHQAVLKGHQFLQTANYLIITFGTAFVYELPDGKIVANNHKMGAGNFKKRLLSVEEISLAWNTVLAELKSINPNLIVIFTISPVRHLRDGVVENNLSKATLIQAVHQIIAKNAMCHYFPAYELMMDDLRDYRFYATDMLHPNQVAIDYIWERFVSAYTSKEFGDFQLAMDVLNAAKAHLPFHPNSEAHLLFKQQQLEKIKKFQISWPNIPLDDMIQHFS